MKRATGVLAIAALAALMRLWAAGARAEEAGRPGSASRNGYAGEVEENAAE